MNRYLRADNRHFCESYQLQREFPCSKTLCGMIYGFQLYFWSVACWSHSLSCSSITFLLMHCRNTKDVAPNPNKRDFRNAIESCQAKICKAFLNRHMVKVQTAVDEHLKHSRKIYTISQLCCRKNPLRLLSAMHIDNYFCSVKCLTPFDTWFFFRITGPLYLNKNPLYDRKF